MSSLLERQLRKYLPPGIDPAAGPWLGLFTAIAKAYDELEADRTLLEHTLEVTSDELNEANDRLRRESADQLRSLSRYYQQTLESQQGMILCVQRTEAGFVHTLCRGQLAARLGWMPETVEGRRLEDFLPSAQASALRPAYECAWNGQECTCEGMSVDGTLAYLAWLRPRIENHVIREVIVSCVEITDRKRVEHELVAAKEHAEAADRAKSEFLAVMSHEIRTPLNAVLGFTALLLETQINEEQRAWLHTIDQSGVTLLTLINDILDFSKIEAGQLQLELRPCDLASLLESVTHLFLPRASEKGLALELRLEPGLPAIIATDTSRLQQILVNLMSNAVKFTAHGSIMLSADASEDTLRITVRDTGIGIAPQQHDRLFKPFIQADSSTTRLYGGTGLGLAICQRLARALGGDISIESAPGQGSTFTLTLPVTHAEQPPPPLAPPHPAEVRNGAPLLVLVVDDDATNRLLITRILGRHGITPDIAVNGRIAVNATQDKSYDLIFMDILMPELDGLNATREIRALMQGRRQPHIVALTASVMPDQQHDYMEAGVDAVLAKPIQFADIAETVSRFRPVAIKTGEAGLPAVPLTKTEAFSPAPRLNVEG